MATSMMSVTVNSLPETRFPHFWWQEITGGDVDDHLFVGYVRYIGKSYVSPSLLKGLSRSECACSLNIIGSLLSTWLIAINENELFVTVMIKVVLCTHVDQTSLICCHSPGYVRINKWGTSSRVHGNMWSTITSCLHVWQIKAPPRPQYACHVNP